MIKPFAKLRRAAAAVIALSLLAAIVAIQLPGSTSASPNLANPQINENSPAGTSAGTPVTANSPAAVAYSISGVDAANFTINSQTGEVSLANGAQLDHEAKPSHSVTITATTTITIDVGNVAESGILTLSNRDPRPGDTIVATLTDPDGGVHNEVWRWSRFTNGEWVVIPGETTNSYTVTNDDIGGYISASVNYTDNVGNAAAARRTNTVQNDSPAFNSPSTARNIDENSPAGSTVGAAVVATDANSHDITYNLAGDSSFTVDQSGQVTVATGAVIDYEAKDQHTFVLSASDEYGGVGRTTVTVTVNNLDEPGSVTLDDYSPGNGDTVSATLTDPDGATSNRSWQWSRSADASAWTAISGATSAAYTVQAADTNHYLSAAVQYTDPHGTGKSASARTNHKVANDQPSFTTADPFNVSIDENNAIGANVGNALEASDPNEDTMTFSLSGTDAASFTIKASGQITATASLDHETKSAYSFTAKVQDPAGGNDTLTVNVTVNNVEEAGTVALSETSPEANVAVTATLTDPDGGVSGESWQWQSGGSSAGPWTNISNATSATYTPTADDVDDYLRAVATYTDGHGSSQDSASAISANAVVPEPNQAPEFDDATTTFNISINVNEGVRVAPPFTATDANGDTLTYSIVSDTQDAFTIDSETGEVLMGSITLDEDSTHTATISVTDGYDANWDADSSADDTLSLTMTIVNPNIVVTPSSNQTYPYGLWVDDDIVVTANHATGNSWVLFYDRDTQVELTDRSFQINVYDFPKPVGVWSNGEILYVLVVNEGSVNARTKIFAYNLDNGNRRSGKDVRLANANRHPAGLTGHDGKLHVGDNSDNMVYAYHIEDRSRDRDSEITGIDRMNKTMTDLWRDDDNVWISYWRSEFIRAYDADSGAHDADLDIQTARENRGPTGIDSDGFNFWALDQVNDTIYGYVLPE